MSIMTFFKKNRWFFAIQGLNVLFSLSGIMVKFASSQMEMHGFFSIGTMLFIISYCVLLIVYAFFWQKVVAQLPLLSAYLGKSLVIFWALVWAWLFLNETISLQNILGALLLFAGTVVVMHDDK